MVPTPQTTQATQATHAVPTSIPSIRSPRRQGGDGSHWVPGRSLLTWGMGYGLARRLFARAAARGDLIARIESERALQLDPWDAFDELRGRGGIVPGAVVHATTSHAVATAVLRSEHFGSSGGHEELPGPLQRAVARLVDPWAATVVDPPSMLAVDGEQHARYRRLVSRAFTARAVGGLEDRIRGIADRLLDDLERDGAAAHGFDLVDRYAALLPVAVIADMLGVPDDMHPHLLEWGNGAALTLDPTMSWSQFRRAEVCMRRLHLWFAAHIRSLREHPGDDLLSRLALAQATDGGEQLSDLELRATGLLVLGAGFETTVNLIGNAVHLLSEHAEQRSALTSDPSLWPHAVEEVLRFDSPVQATLRLAHADTEVCGQPVARGTGVLLYLGGANRDPDVFVDPHRFDVARENASSHLAFSSGAHFCLGAALARREAEVGLRALYERFPDLTVSGPPVRRGTRVLRGWEHLPVTVSTSVAHAT